MFLFYLNFPMLYYIWKINFISNHSQFFHLIFWNVISLFVTLFHFVHIILYSDFVCSFFAIYAFNEKSLNVLSEYLLCIPAPMPLHHLQPFPDIRNPRTSNISKGFFHQLQTHGTLPSSTFSFLFIMSFRKH